MGLVSHYGKDRRADPGMRRFSRKEVLANMEDVGKKIEKKGPVKESLSTDDNNVRSGIFRLGIGEYVKIDVHVHEVISKTGHFFGKRPLCKYIVSSEFPVSTYFLSKKGMGTFPASKDHSNYKGEEYCRYRNMSWRLGFNGLWYLVIWNSGDKETAVYYKIF